MAKVEYETAELVVSFLAVDSTGKHETGEPYTWNNRITIKSRVYGSSPDLRVELRTAPSAPTRYTTDGSDPKVAGGAYDDPFAVPVASRFVLAVAEDKGIVSETHRVSVDWERGPTPVPEEPIDPDRPATWRPLSHPEKIFHFSTAHSAYGFIERLKKHGGKAAAQRIAVLDGQWVELTLADEMLLGTDQLHATVEHLRSLVSEGEVSIEASALWFPTGQQLLDYVHDIAVELPRGEVEQE